MSELQGKVVLITGAKGGLGTFVTQAFLDAGATVVGVSRSISAADFPHPKFAAHAASLSSSGAAQAVVESTVQKNGRLDVLVHLMGGFAGGSSIAETEASTLEEMFDVNLKSAFFGIAAAVPPMRKQGSGRILAIGSKAAVEPQPGVGVYSASKAALVSLIRTAALENGDAGITANIVLPGTMDTPANRAAMPGADRKGWVSPAEVAGLLAYLASDAASQVTGAVIPVYGSGG